MKTRAESSEDRHDTTQSTRGSSPVRASRSRKAQVARAPEKNMAMTGSTPGGTWDASHARHSHQAASRPGIGGPSSASRPRASIRVGCTMGEPASPRASNSGSQRAGPRANRPTSATSRRRGSGAASKRSSHRRQTRGSQGQAVESGSMTGLDRKRTSARVV